MNDDWFVATWPDEALTLFIILALVMLNFIFLFIAWTHKHRRRKVELELLAVQTFGSASPFVGKRSLDKEKNRLHTETDKNVGADVSCLKIDKAISMLKKGCSLEEIKTALDIEPSYIKILATHHTG